MKLRRIVEEDEVEVLKNTSEIKDIKEKKITPTEDAATASAIDSIKVNKENAEKYLKENYTNTNAKANKIKIKIKD